MRLPLLLLLVLLLLGGGSTACCSWGSSSTVLWSSLHLGLIFLDGLTAAANPGVATNQGVIHPSRSLYFATPQRGIHQGGGHQDPSHQEVLLALSSTDFSCDDQQHPGYYADVSTNCRGFHICQSDGRHDVFVCPNNTAFHQQFLVCDWNEDVECQDAPLHYDINARIHLGTFQQLHQAAHMGREIRFLEHSVIQPHLQSHMSMFEQLTQQNLRGSEHTPLLESIAEQFTHSTPSFMSTAALMEPLVNEINDLRMPQSALLRNHVAFHPSF